MDMFGHDPRRQVIASAIILSMVIVGAVLAFWLTGNGGQGGLFFTADQHAMKAYKNDNFDKAANGFHDARWQAAALFRAGQFKQSASVLSGYEDAESLFNRGNALVMMGKYDDAVKVYDDALKVRAVFDDARVNRDLAIKRAERIKREGGEGTEGQLGADKIVFEQGKNNSRAEEVELRQTPSDAELRSIWLRKVQTHPADFLRVKFSYQAATKSEAVQ